jgi:hypothetical protein
MKINISTDNNGVTTVNDLTFLEFTIGFRGYLIVRKTTGAIVPKFLLFWNGFSIADVKSRFNLQKRIPHHDY